MFSKIYQTLKLDVDRAAGLTAESGLDGVNCPVRPGKDMKRPRQFVPFGKGKLSRLKQMGLTTPISMHIEFDWSNLGKDKLRLCCSWLFNTASARSNSGWLRHEA
ncbi:MAG: hypothetical protein NT105_06355 [Verrucomicrobia bacterium]|nr:hypothetical protein [Verrucomicrobiota bacterium]